MRGGQRSAIRFVKEADENDDDDDDGNRSAVDDDSMGEDEDCNTAGVTVGVVESVVPEPRRKI